MIQYICLIFYISIMLHRWWCSNRADIQRANTRLHATNGGLA